jgi:hypothetical protein
VEGIAMSEPKPIEVPFGRARIKVFLLERVGTENTYLSGFQAKFQIHWEGATSWQDAAGGSKPCVTFETWSTNMDSVVVVRHPRMREGAEGDEATWQAGHLLPRIDPGVEYQILFILRKQDFADEMSGPYEGGGRVYGATCRCLRGS